MRKKLFHVTKTQTNTGLNLDCDYAPTLRNVLLYLWLIHRSGVGVRDMPDGDWILNFSWAHSRIVPGLMFTEA